MGRRGAAETGKRMNRWREIRKNGQVRTTSRPLRYSQRGVATIFVVRRATLVLCPHKPQANFFRADCAARTRRRTRCIGQNVGLAVSADVPCAGRPCALPGTLRHPPRAARPHARLRRHGRARCDVSTPSGRAQSSPTSWDRRADLAHLDTPSENSRQALRTGRRWPPTSFQGQDRLRRTRRERRLHVQ